MTKKNNVDIEDDKCKNDIREKSILKAIKNEMEKSNARARARANSKAIADARKNIEKNYLNKASVDIRNYNYQLQVGRINEYDVPVSLGATAGSLIDNNNNVKYEQSECSCRGNNERCSRCYGTGFYAKKIIKNYIFEAESVKSRTGYKEVGFASDSRGGSYSIREAGRFSSSPIFDGDQEE